MHVTVFEGAPWDFMPDWPNDAHVADFIDWLQSVLAEIPEEYRGFATIDIESVGGYEDEHHAELSIKYWRPETEEEAAMRLAREDSMQEYRETEERRQLAALKAKYETDESGSCSSS